MNKLRVLIAPFCELINNKDLFSQTLRRSVAQKYKGSYLGIAWNLIMPLIMLSVYTIVFGIVFKAKWDIQVSDSKAEFALALFAGITIYSMFSEVISASPTIIVGNTNYVKKVIFPLEILTMTSIGTSLVQVFFNVVIIVIGKMIFMHFFDLTPLFLIVILIPLIFLLAGLSWIISSIGVFVKDMQQIASVVTLIFGYLTPVFYPVEVVPDSVKFVMYINPLTYIVINARKVLVYKMLPDFRQLAIVTFASYMIMMLGYYFFRKVKVNFADML